MTNEEIKIRSLRHARIRRVKQFLRWLPRRANLEKYPVIKWFAKGARKRPFLWSFKVANVTPAFYAGSIIAFLPFYGIQFGLAVAVAFIFRANLPITCGLQILTNPLTLPPVYLINYMIGKKIIAIFEFGESAGGSGNWFHALMIGGFFTGLVLGGILDVAYRLAAWQGARHSVKTKLIIKPIPKSK